LDITIQTRDGCNQKSRGDDLPPFSATRRPLNPATTSPLPLRQYSGNPLFNYPPPASSMTHNYRYRYSLPRPILRSLTSTARPHVFVLRTASRDAGPLFAAHHGLIVPLFPFARWPLRYILDILSLGERGHLKYQQIHCDFICVFLSKVSKVSNRYRLNSFKKTHHSITM